MTPRGVYADYSSASLSPASGTIYGDSTGIVLSVNSGSDEYIGIDANISFTGSVQYLSATESKCSSFQVTESDGTLNVECIFMGDGSPYSGSVATLYFKATATGESVFTFDSTSPNATSKSGGTYTLSTSATPSDDGDTGSTSATPSDDGDTGSTSATPSDDDGALPQTGVLDNNIVVLVGGFLLLFLGIFFEKTSTFVVFLGHGITRFVETSKEKAMLQREQKRRKSLEDRF
jgi:LPXTG-motif cell wall-anchored protein